MEISIMRIYWNKSKEILKHKVPRILKHSHAFILIILTFNKNINLQFYATNNNKKKEEEKGEKLKTSIIIKILFNFCCLCFMGIYLVADTQLQSHQFQHYDEYRYFNMILNSCRFHFMPQMLHVVVVVLNLVKIDCPIIVTHSNSWNILLSICFVVA